jgi:hypothetical protein
VADCDTYHYLVAAKLKERLLVSKQAAQSFNMQRLDLRKRNDAGVKKEYQVKISNGFAVLKTWMIMWTSIGLGKMLERISKF